MYILYKPTTLFNRIYNPRTSFSSTPWPTSHPPLTSISTIVVPKWWVSSGSEITTRMKRASTSLSKISTDVPLAFFSPASSRSFA